MSSKQPNAGFFTRAEDQAILDFITKDHRFLFCGGLQIWKKAESENICPGRTFWSIKERFRKTILKNLDRYKLDEDIRKKMVGFTKASADGKAKLRFELATPEDYEYLHAGEHQKDNKDESDEERDTEEDDEEEEAPRGTERSPEKQKDTTRDKLKDKAAATQKDRIQEKQKDANRDKQKDNTTAKQKDTIQEKQTSTTSDSTKLSKKIGKETLHPSQKSPTKNIESNASAIRNKPAAMQPKNTKKTDSSGDNNKDSGPQRRSQRNQTNDSTNTKATSPKKASSPKKAPSPKKASPKGVKKLLTPEKKNKALITKTKQLKVALKNL